MADAKHAVARIEALTGIRLCESQARRLMKKLGLKPRKTAPIPGKCDPQLQFDFYTSEMLPRLEKAVVGERKVMFVDAAHFVLGVSGHDLVLHPNILKTTPVRQCYNVLAAIDSHHHETISIRTTENINAQTIQSLLDKIRDQHPLVPITLVMDNARYQHCAAVEQHAARHQIELLFLPPLQSEPQSDQTSVEAD